MVWAEYSQRDMQCLLQILKGLIEVKLVMQGNSDSAHNVCSKCDLY